MRAKHSSAMAATAVHAICPPAIVAMLEIKVGWALWPAFEPID
jgi:hypothetical protein